MLTRAVRTRLVVFAVLSVAILTGTAISYVHLPHLLGFDQYRVRADFADTSGLYDNAIVTYRGAQVGKVAGIALRSDGVTVTLSLDNGTRIPADAVASIHSTSAVGEQYVDLVPRGAESALLHDGSTIPRNHTRGLPQTADLIDSLDALLRSIPKDELAHTLDDLATAFGGAGPDLQRLLDSTSRLLDAASANFGPTKALLDQLGPFLRTQQDIAGQTTSTVADLAAFSHQLVLSNSDIVSLLHEVPPLSRQLTGLERDLSPTLNVLLADLTSNGRVLDVYIPAVKQTLTIYPALVATLIGFAQPTAASGSIPLYFHLNLNDPGLCEKGFLPVDKRRDPSVTSVTSTPTGLYCKEPHTSQHSVRGTRNLPCLNNPGVRAGTPAACLGLPEPTGSAQLPAASAPYEPGTGKVLAPDGKFYLVGDAVPSGEEHPTWQNLLLRPIGR